MKNKILALEKILTNSKQQDSEKNQLRRKLFFYYDGKGLGKRNLQEKEFVLPVIHSLKFLSFFFLLFLQYPS